MRKPNVIHLEGRDYVVVPREDYERLEGLAKLAEVPALPQPDSRGNYPAVEYLRSSIARNVVRDRIGAGLTQRGLAKLAGVRVETLCRIETGKHTASTATIDKLDRALKRAMEAKGKRSKPAKTTKRRRRAS